MNVIAFETLEILLESEGHFRKQREWLAISAMKILRVKPRARFNNALMMENVDLRIASQQPNLLDLFHSVFPDESSDEKAPTQTDFQSEK